MSVIHLSIVLCSDNDMYTAADNGEEFQAYTDIYHGDTWPGYHAQRVQALKEDIPLIIWWTDTDSGGLCPHTIREGRAKYARVTCPNGAVCYSTSEKTSLHDKHTRGLMFYGTDVDPSKFPLPRTKQHEWALIHEESPLNNFMLSHFPMISLFNHTATFRRESDYPLSTMNIPQPDYLIRRKPVSLTEKNTARSTENLAPVVYVQSHCDVPSDRDSYVKELMKYIDVDSYGACLHNKDLPERLREPAETFEHDDFYDILSKYKFNLAFENGYCDDYMTEKIMRPLHIGVVPIYKGSPKVRDWMPDNTTVILVGDYNSPKELAEFITFLDTHDEEYEKYQTFKKTGITNTFLANHLEKREWGEGQRDFFRGFECYVCKQLVDRMTAEKAHKKDPSLPLLPTKTANNSHMGCPVPQRLYIGENTELFWPHIDWTSIYWNDLDRARAAHHMIQKDEADATKFEKYHRVEMAKARKGH